MPCIGLAAEFSFPSNMTVDDIPIIVRSFNSGFLARAPIGLLGQDKYQTEITFRHSYINTSTVSKLGTGSQDHPVQVQEVLFSRQLPFDVELGVQSNLTMFDRNISTYGGYARWGLWNLPWGGVSLLGLSSSARYKSLMSANLYGGSLLFDLKLWQLSVSLGTGLMRTTNSFEASLFGTSGFAENQTYAKSFAHQSVKVAYFMNQFVLSIQADWLDRFFGSAELSYLF